MTLNKEQENAVAAVKRGRNIFLTGAGGTGKSHTIRAILSWGSAAGRKIATTAMTGCAALLLTKAKTVHSWAGVGLGKGSPTELVAAVKRSKHASRRWINTQILIIDEISMMLPLFLETLDQVARQIRKQPDVRFGGLQIVFAGDFCQLPPIGSTISTFAFESPLWSTLIDETHNLTEIVRQIDPVFQNILKEARMGALSAESLAILQSRKDLDWASNEIRPTLLYSRNIDVDRINRLNMEALEGPRQTYEALTVTASAPGKSVRVINAAEEALTKLDKDASYVLSLELCVGAQVMLLTNMDQEHGLVNGSRGVVTAFSLGGLPMVRFLNQRDPMIIDRVQWWLPQEDGGPLLGRSQIPLRVAYAITIHKSQGATLDAALIDIGSSTFEYGQAYVALSRCRSLENLYIWKLDPSKIICHPVVRAFYERLISVSSSSSEEREEVDNDPWLISRLSQVWQTIVESKIKMIQAKLPSAVEPPAADVFAALRACPDPTTVKVIILGQDPYPTAGLAHGLAFSVRPSATIPASLKNIYKELVSDMAIPTPITGCLQRWADQGVLLLNDILTVEVGKPMSHASQGWEQLTTEILATVLKEAAHVVLIIWGRIAQKKLESPAIKPLLAKHTVLTAPHPSPLSAHTGFYGSKPFSQTNAALVAHGQEAIDWSPA